MKGATLKDVARAAQVSIASASRVMNGLNNVTAEVRARVLEAASQLHYVPHWGARSLAINRTNTIGLLLPDIYGEFFSEIIRGVDVAARAKGFHLLVAGSHGDLGETVATMRAMSGLVDGLLVMAPSVDSQDLATVLPYHLPLVTIASHIGTANHHAIGIDNYRGGDIAARHLKAIGCRAVAHISGPLNNFEAQERRRGFETAMRDIYPGSPLRSREGAFTEDSGYDCTRAYLAEDIRPDGLFIANDMMAVGALLALKEAGLSVPGDVAIIGFDDIPITRFTSPPLSTLRVGVYELGRRGMDMLIAALEAGADILPRQEVIIAPELIVRDSSRRQ